MVTLNIARVRAVYFSPTGTTGKIVTRIADTIATELALASERFDFTLPNARSAAPSFAADELVVFGTPVYVAFGYVYSAGAALLDLEQPWRVIHRAAPYILSPQRDYECVGDVPNVVFPSGLIVEEYDDQGFARFDSPFLLYYGAADTVIAAASR